MAPIIVITLLIGAVMSVVEFLIEWSIIKAFRLADWYYRGEGLETTATSIYAYIDKFAGPQVMIHSFHSHILTTFFVCLMFGSAMPILYPIGFLTFLLTYISHRLQLFYFYRQPPMYD